jgi:hypothetical protein
MLGNMCGLIESALSLTVFVQRDWYESARPPAQFDQERAKFVADPLRPRELSAVLRKVDGGAYRPAKRVGAADTPERR